MRPPAYLLLRVILSIAAIGTFSTAVFPQENLVLAPGDPPLTRSIVFKSIDFLEWSLDIRLSSEQKTQIEKVLVNAWRRNDLAQIRSVLDVVDIHNSLSGLALEERNKSKGRLKSVLLENLRKNPAEELNHIVLSAVQPDTGKMPDPSVNGRSDRKRSENAEQSDPKYATQPESSKLWTSSQHVPLTFEQAKDLLDLSGPIKPRPVVSDTAPLKLEQAIASVRQFLNDGIGPKAIADFYASPEGKDADRAALVAAGAMVRGLPVLTTAALLRAHELQPNDPTHLVNLAAVLSYIELPRESLAILDSPIVKSGEISSPFESTSKAIYLTIRGFTLLKLGRTKDAEDVLRQAVSDSPQLHEARINLSAALWTQDDPKKKEEAVRLVAAVWRRSMPTKKFDAIESAPPPTSVDGEIAVEVFTPEENGTAGLDLSRGKRLKLPDLKIPASIEASVSMHSKYEKLRNEIRVSMTALEARQSRLLQIKESKEQREIERAANSGDPSSVLAIANRQKTYEKFDALLNWEAVRQNPSVKPYWEKLRKAALNNYQGAHFDQRDPAAVPAGVADPGSQSDQLARKFAQIEGRVGLPSPVGRDEDRTKRCAATRDAMSKWRAGLHDYDTAFRNYLQAAYKYKTGVIANISDPVEHELAQIRIEQQIYFAWLTEGVAYADSFYRPADEAMKYYCRNSTSPSGEDLENVESEKADRCPDELKGRNKVSIDLGIVSVSFNCESLGVEVSNPVPWITPFIEWEGKFKGGWISRYEGSTIGFGVKAGTKIPGIGAIGVKPGISQKAGGYIKVDKNGNIKDYGIKTGTSVKMSGGTKILDLPVGVGFKTGDSLTTSFVPTMGIQ